MHDQAMSPADPRTEFIAARRELADYLTEHPALPVPLGRHSVSVFPHLGTDADERAWVDQFAAMTGATAAEQNGYYRATKSFDPIEYGAVAIFSARQAACRAELSYQGCIQPESLQS